VASMEEEKTNDVRCKGQTSPYKCCKTSFVNSPKNNRVALVTSICFFPTDEKIIKTFERKSKTAAWFVSNCNLQTSLRNELTKDLQKLGVEVDIFGACGTLQTPKDNVYEFLELNYKFYFSFENSLCEDYVVLSKFD
jgi:hypothetical protein